MSPRHSRPSRFGPGRRSFFAESGSLRQQLKQQKHIYFLSLFRRAGPDWRTAQDNALQEENVGYDINPRNRRRRRRRSL